MNSHSKGTCVGSAALAVLKDSLFRKARIAAPRNMCPIPLRGDAFMQDRKLRTLMACSSLALSLCFLRAAFAADPNNVTPAGDVQPAGQVADAGAEKPQTASPPGNSATTSSSLAETTVHLYYLVSGYTDIQDKGSPKKVYCSRPRAQLRIGADNGTDLTVAVDSSGPALSTDEEPCVSPDSYIKKGGQYTIAKSAVLNASPTIQGFVSGVLAVPFKYHLSDHSITAGSTIGGYVGYRTSVGNQFAITPVLGGGLALVSTSAAQASNAGATGSPNTTTNGTATNSSSQTSSGLSIATGFIGSVTSAASKGAQFGIILGVDWLGKNSKYAYEGKPWIAFEVGYNFAL